MMGTRWPKEEYELYANAHRALGVEATLRGHSTKTTVAVSTTSASSPSASASHDVGAVIRNLPNQ